MVLNNFPCKFVKKRYFLKQFSKMKQLHKSGRKWIMYSSMGLELGLSVVIGFLIGSWLDDWLRTDPWFLLVFGIAGIISGYRSIFRLVKRVQADSDSEQDK